MTAPDPLPLDSRDGLPPDLLALLADYPRGTWEAHPDFYGLVAFWLDRHLGFRRVMGMLIADAEGLIDGRLAPEAYRSRLVRLGSGLLGDLTGHHQIEDQHYFPQLAAMEARLARGFDILDRDHHALHDRIDRFAAGANAALGQGEDAAFREMIARFGEELAGFQTMLIRHLSDEEDLVVPVILKHRVG
jgi:hypothetical protein